MISEGDRMLFLSLFYFIWGKFSSFRVLCGV